MLAPAATPLLQLLWPAEWTVHPLPSEADAACRPVLHRPADGGPAALHLPPQAQVHWAAMAAHAAAHHRFGGAPMPRRGLKPVQQVLLGVLEDARVEWLACQYWPGLAAWWKPFHPVSPETAGPGFEGLLARLSACLLDVRRSDPHPWIERVRQVFFEPDRCTLALRTPAEVRAAASVLGNEIGQMRLPFQPVGYRVHAAYRDDNLHLWLPDDEDRTALILPDLQDAAPHAAPPADPTGWVFAEPAARHAEWNHRSGRYRANWVTVYEHHWPLQPVAQARPLDATLLPPPAVPVDRHSRRRAAGRDGQGDELHGEAVVEHALARRTGLPHPDRVWQRCRPQPVRAGVLLLVDASVSTQGELARWQQQVEQVARWMERSGLPAAVWAFASDGRHRVRLQRLKNWTDRCDAVPWGRLQPDGSTRMGAALRHAALLSIQAMHQQVLQTCTVVLISDGEVHDIDVHDSQYLVADLRHAVRELRGKGIGLMALTDGPAPELVRAMGADTCHRIGPAGWRRVVAGVLRPANKKA